MVLTEDRLLPKTENERKWVCSNFQKGITSAKARTLFGGVLCFDDYYVGVSR